jgi:hypothetical protein
MLITFYGFLHGVLGVGVDKMWEKNGWFLVVFIEPCYGHNKCTWGGAFKGLGGESTLQKGQDFCHIVLVF